MTNFKNGPASLFNTWHISIGSISMSNLLLIGKLAYTWFKSFLFISFNSATKVHI
jgi:hypothetical protein